MSVFNEKEVEYEIEYIDLSNKPDWFLAISPTGKVPVVQTPDGDVLFESAVINEYLDEVHEPRLMPEKPLARAQERMWCDFMTGVYGDAYRLYTAKTEEIARENAASAKARLAKMEEAINGPLFNGDSFGMVDATAAPPFRRLAWAEEIEPSLGIFDDLPKVALWKDTLLTRPSVQNSILPNLYDVFVDNLRQRELWLGTRLA